MDEKKMTKKDYYNELKEIIANANVENGEDLVAFCDKQIAQIDAKAEKNKERAAEKRAEGDELRAVVKSVLTGEYQTADDITAQIEGEDITKSKIIARLTQLVKAGDAVKEEAKGEDGKKKMTYKLAD